MNLLWWKEKKLKAVWRIEKEGRSSLSLGRPTFARTYLKILQTPCGMPASEALKRLSTTDQGRSRRRRPGRASWRGFIGRILRFQYLLPSLFKTLNKYVGLSETVVRFWPDRKNKESKIWTTHHDINRVMLATTLTPEGFLMI